LEVELTKYIQKSIWRIVKKIKENGMLISEYSPNKGQRAYHFPRRNRIIAGMSKCTIVIESKKLGAL